jgi:dTMP kinase
MINMLADKLKLRGYNCFLTFQPTEPMRKSNIFRSFMDNDNNDSYSFLSLNLQAAADRVQHCEKVILPRLKAGEIVISDRYFFSCIANLRAKGYKDSFWIYDIAKYIPKPDLAFFLEVPAQKAIQRVRMRPKEKDRFIDANLQYKLFDEYRIACNNTENGVLIKSDRDEIQTFEDIWDNVSKILKEEQSILSVSNS